MDAILIYGTIGIFCLAAVLVILAGAEKNIELDEEREKQN